MPLFRCIFFWRGGGLYASFRCIYSLDIYILSIFFNIYIYFFLLFWGVGVGLNASFYAYLFLGGRGGGLYASF